MHKEITAAENKKKTPETVSSDQWRSGAKCRPEPTIKMPLFAPRKFAYKKWK